MFQNRSTHLRSRTGALSVTGESDRRLRCPRCHDPILAIKHPNANPSFCRGCDGLFVLGVDVEAYLGHHAAAAVKRPRASFAQWTDRAPLRCPTGCDGAMQHRQVGNATFELCPLCEGLWFERGMVAALQASAERAAESQLSSWLV
jgi:Transcription factor zinc-finger